MSIVEAIESNFVQLIATACVGVTAYGGYRRYPTAIVILAYVVSLGIAFSLFAGVGEVYRYSPFYQRAFFFFSDEITTVLGAVFCYAVAARARIAASITAFGVFASGGKIGILLMLIMSIAIVAGVIRGPKIQFRELTLYLVLGMCAYALTLGVVAVDKTLSRNGNTTTVDSGQGETQQVRQKQGVEGGAACRTLEKCLYTQVISSVRYRLASSTGGLWMTLEGGFNGDAYPATPDEFADLMMENNPWGINERYGLKHLDWKRMGAPQNAYLRFGAGYGPWLLTGVLIGIGWLVVAGWVNLLRGESLPMATFTLFFIVNGTLNMTQPWLTSGSIILGAMGFCGAHIAWIHLRRVINNSRLLETIR